MVFVKVCGITRAQDAQVAAELGARAVGFVFWPESPRFIEPERARAIRETLPPFVTPVGVFVDQPLDYVRRVVQTVGLGVAQLHGRESATYSAAVGCQIIKAVAVTESGPVESLEQVLPAATLLLDAHDPIHKGGTGRSIDWTHAADVARRHRVILSGGLRPDTVAAGIESVRPYGVDVSSGVEVAPGKKDAGLLQSFFAAVAEGRWRDREGEA